MLEALLGGKLREVPLWLAVQSVEWHAQLHRPEIDALFSACRNAQRHLYYAASVHPQRHTNLCSEVVVSSGQPSACGQLENRLSTRASVKPQTKTSLIEADRTKLFGTRVVWPVVLVGQFASFGVFGQNAPNIRI